MEKKKNKPVIKTRPGERTTNNSLMGVVNGGDTLGKRGPQH